RICTVPENLLFEVRRSGDPRRKRLLGTACCRRLERFLVRQASRTLIDVSERHADGLATDEELRLAFEAVGGQLPGGPGTDGPATDEELRLAYGWLANRPSLTGLTPAGVPTPGEWVMRHKAESAVRHLGTDCPEYAVWSFTPTEAETEAARGADLFW